MKRFSVISLLVLLIPIAGIGQNQNTFLDDIYFKPSDANKIQKIQVNKQKSSYKNGVKEIVFIERESPTSTTTASDTTILSQIYDSIPNDSQNTGYYLNEFNGNESDKEYAERIRRFHNPKYSIFIGDPRYNDVYFLNNSDWNVYVDDSYAYVTPTWTNPYWWNYNYGPMYGSWGYNNYSPDYGFGGWNNYPWSYNNFYGYGGFGGYYGYGYPYCYYGGYYGGYYGYGGGNLGGISSRNKNYDESNRRATTNYNNRGTTRLGGTRSDAASSTINAGGNGTTQGRNPYTIISGSASNSNANTRLLTNTTRRTVLNQGNGIGLVRNTTNRVFNNSTNISSNLNTNSRTSTINTQPRTYRTTSNSVSAGNYTTQDNNSTTVSSFRNSNSSITHLNTSSGSSTVSPSRGNYSSGSSSSGVSRSSSSPTYTAPSSSSYSSGSSSSSSRSSGSGSRSSDNSGGGGRR